MADKWEGITKEISSMTEMDLLKRNTITETLK